MKEAIQPTRLHLVLATINCTTKHHARLISFGMPGKYRVGMSIVFAQQQVLAYIRDQKNGRSNGSIFVLNDFLK
ncbi:hypothetical protein [Pseudomonas khavaziana]|uniref:hypothetical protein n=1 Tax=Pseudomonas khavaziana TaxID=2842351 RepID=UPI001C3DD032|nr:hypothetical protein [Pseudomonas khavaziana]MBV4480712.1 hypothetical protein [Pseudomonas khavaziana]